MDLYIQIGIILLFLTAGSLVIYYSAFVYNESIEIFDEHNKPNADYHGESALTTRTFTVDSSTMQQWASNISDQNDLYVVFTSTLPATFLTDKFKEYRVGLTFTADYAHGNHTFNIDNNIESNNRKALKYIKGSWQSKQAVQYVADLGDQASRNYKVTILAIPDKQSGKLVYLALGGW